MNIQGVFSQIQFVTVGGFLTSQRNFLTNKKANYPFPQKYPGEVEAYLLPGNHIPSDDPEIRKIANSLIRTGSNADMIQTARDIVYSALIQNIAFDNTQVGLMQATELGEGTSKIGFVQGVSQTLKKKKGGQHAKARLVCSLARATGIPARIVMGNRGNVWSQFWIAGLGWVPVEASYPVYDYVRPWRTSLPKLFYSDEYITLSIADTDDNVSRISWHPAVKAYYVNVATEELKHYRELSKAKIIFMKIAQGTIVPENVKMQACEDVFTIAAEVDGTVQLLFQDYFGRILQKTLLSFDGLSHTVNIGDRLFWRFIPRRIGQILVIENLFWKTKEDIFEEKSQEILSPVPESIAP
jgi:hypothetical protein